MRRLLVSRPLAYLGLSFLLSAGCIYGSILPGPTQTPSPLSPATSTQVAISPSLPTATPTLEAPGPSATPSTPVLASYFVTWADGVGELEACLLGYGQYTRILYADGHLVIRTPDGYREAWLSEAEINALLSSIEDTGFLRVEGDGSEREDDSIYHVPEGYLPPDGLPYEEMTILEKHVTIYAPLFDYLIPEVRNARDLLLSYAPASTVPYGPSALEVWLFELPGPDVAPGTYGSTPIPPIVEWPGNLPQLRDLLVGDDVARAVFDGDSVSALRELFPRLPSSRIVRQGDVEYLAAACPVLP